LIGLLCRGLRALLLLCLVAIPAGPAGAAGTVAAQSGDWLTTTTEQLDAVAAADVAAAPNLPAALARLWRSTDARGSAVGALADLGWVILYAALALLAERLVARLLSRRRRRLLRATPDAPNFLGFLALLGADLAGIAAFIAIFAHARSDFFTRMGISAAALQLAIGVLIRWRAAMLVLRLVLRPDVPSARLILLSDVEARRLSWFLSGLILAINVMVGLSRYAPTIGLEAGVVNLVRLCAGILAWGLIGVAVVRARAAGEALIRGEEEEGVLAVIRAALARAWLPAGLGIVAVLALLLVFGLSLGLLIYDRAIVYSIGVWLVAIVLERLTAKAWRDRTSGRDGIERGLAVACHHTVRAGIFLAAATGLAAIWIDVLDLSPDSARRAVHSVMAAAAMLFAAAALWEIAKFAIDRHLAVPIAVPGLAGEETPPPASRLRTVLPFLRAALAVAIGVIAVLLVLSQLGVNTTPLIAGASVFGLAVSFGSQSLVRDIVSGLFYMWDDAFRVGEYIDTGRLKGTVEGMSLRSVRLRHQNGPLHTIPFGQLGAVTNLSRDWAIVKFNLRLESGCDLELVRKTAKQIGIAMQEDPEFAVAVIVPLKLQGILDIVDGVLIVRFKFTARPDKTSWIQREYLKRLYKEFPEKGIAFAPPIGVLPQKPPAEPATAPPSERLPSRVA
jgi:small-conductance mechanosensitive channel